MDTENKRRQISIGVLPSGSSVLFKDSTYFLRNRPGSSLPSPSEVRAHQRPGQYGPVQFESLGLLVKYGKEITIAEGQCLWALRRFLPSEVPAPEVYGWCEDNSEVFIYMELIRGVTLENKWKSLLKQERETICSQLQGILLALRQLQQDSKDQFLGHINRQPLLDIIFTNNKKPSAGPFTSVKEFHDWLSYLTKEGKEIHWPDPSQIPDPFRHLLPDNSTITFTHADLHPSNIIVSTDSPYHIVAIIDWHQSGWYPDYWEYCKAVFTADPNGEWETEYIPRFLEVAYCYNAWSYYPQTLGY
ncbi:kinase-like domain-containing protein [Tricladium varicosporioides]|nr:kinase-like domain-containing protein [Hymenoscyphus varicosporioides]